MLLQRVSVHTVQHRLQKDLGLPCRVTASVSGLMGRGGLYFLPKNATMNGDCYIECLKDHLLLPYEIHGTSIFMHDKAPCYMSNKVKTFLAEKGIEVLE